MVSRTVELLSCDSCGSERGVSGVQIQDSTTNRRARVDLCEDCGLPVRELLDRFARKRTKDRQVVSRSEIAGRRQK